MSGECAVSNGGNRCPACYSCIRSCLVKALKVNNGQTCNRCVCISHCSQGTKQVATFVPQIEELPAGPGAVAVVNPVFPAAVHPAREDGFSGFRSGQAYPWIGKVQPSGITQPS